MVIFMLRKGGKELKRTIFLIRLQEKSVKLHYEL
tara:strand:- start:321 stop:422 length:102 start_codon:yes stop_codon:yes gene_type:complete